MADSGVTYAIPGPGAAAFLASGASAWAAANVNPGLPNSGGISIGLIITAIVLAASGIAIEYLHRPKRP